MSNKLKDKVREIQFHKSFTIDQVAKSIGYSRPYLNKEMNKEEDDKYTAALLGLLDKEYPELTTAHNPESQTTLLNQDVKPTHYEFMPVQVLEISSQRKYSLGGYLDKKFIQNLPITYVAKEHEIGNYLIFLVSGDGMDNRSRRAILQGDKLLAKELPKRFWKTKLFHNQYVFILVTKDGCFCREISTHNAETGDLTIHCWNDIYEDQKINLADVLQLFHVKRIVDRVITL